PNASHMEMYYDSDHSGTASTRASTPSISTSQLDLRSDYSIPHTSSPNDLSLHGSFHNEVEIPQGFDLDSLSSREEDYTTSYTASNSYQNPFEGINLLNGPTRITPA
ncbi:hypothetical protein PENTCL1PPCAC_12248, partial [Pristionchus entomophagus]